MKHLVYPLSEGLAKTLNALCRCRNFSPNVHFKEKKSAPTVGAAEGTKLIHLDEIVSRKGGAVK